MKQLFCIIAITILLIPRMQGQTFAANLPGMSTEMKQPAMPDFTQYSHSKGTGKGIWITGIVSMGVGAAMVFAGGIVDISAGTSDDVYYPNGQPNSSVNNEHIGNAMIITGAAVFVAGTGMLIGGLVAYHHSKHKYSLVSPKRNQFGVAYNF